MDSQSKSNSPSNDDPLARLARSLEDIDTAEAAQAESAADDARAPTLLPALRFLGDYELLEPPLGYGGQGSVYRARQRSLDRFVAVKVIAGQFAFDATRVARFRAEPLAASKVQHPGMVSVHFVGEQNGIHYIAQELIEGGRTLAHLIKERRAAPPADHDRSMAELFAKVADALEAVHQAKVIHRDIKPGNILLTPQGEPKVADFGLARDLDAPGMSASDASPGTIEYMSPEQVDRQLGAVDARTDVYGLGVTLYEALTFTPWVLTASRLEAQRIILEEEMRDLRTVRAAVPIELTLICRKAVEKEPPRRYQSMAEFAADLRRYLNHQPILAEPPSAARRAQLWARRHRVAAALIASSVVVATVSTGAALKISDQNKKLGEQERVAVQNLNDVLSLSAQKDHDDLVAEAQKLWPAHPEMIPAYEDWLRRANELIDGRPANEAKGLKKRPSLAEHKAKLAELRAHAKPLSEEQIRADRESHPKYAELQAKQAELLWMSRMLRDAPWPSDAVVEAELAKESLPTEAAALNELAWPLVDPAKPVYGQEVRALLLAQRAVAAASAETRSGVRDTLAWAFFKLGRLDEALDEVRVALSEPGGEALQSSATDLEKAVALWRGDELAKRRGTRDKLAVDVAALATLVNERRTYEFDDPEKDWWNRQLVKLLSDLEALRDSQSGLMNDVLAEPFGWGVAKRYEIAKSIGERSIDSPEAKRLWSGAIAAIKASPKYGGLEIVPQMGLIPIGVDPDSQLWEFAHLQTGDPAVRGEDEKLVMTEETGLVLVLIPGGAFWMGAQNKVAGPNHDPQSLGSEAPVHRVVLTSYFVSKYEMTQSQWMRLTGVNPSLWRPPSAFVSNLLHPVEQVSWDSCRVVLGRIGFSLPSEAQWEHSARGGTTTVWWTGQDRESLRNKANLADQTAARAGAAWTSISDWLELYDGSVVHGAIGTREANQFGLHEVAGNVAEWCLDTFDPGFYARSGSVNPVAIQTERPMSAVYRGGAFDLEASSARSASRNYAMSDARVHDVGLRPARDLHHSSSKVLPRK